MAATGVVESGLAMNLGGDIVCKRFTVSYTALTGTSTASTNIQQVKLFTLKAESVIIGTRSRVRTLFAGTSITDMDVTVGWGAPTNSTTLAATNDDVIANVDLDTSLVSSPNGAGTAQWITLDADTDIYAYFIPTGANTTALTAGKVSFDIFVFNQTSPTTAGL